MLLHSQVVQPGALMLMDAGCERHGYASDITRTWPISGRFSGPQRAVYDVVLAAHRYGPRPQAHAAQLRAPSALGPESCRLRLAGLVVRLPPCFLSEQEPAVGGLEQWSGA